MQRIKAFIDTFEETMIVVLMAAMTLVTFSQVIARYVFNTGWGSALELTQVIFAWLILFGMSYGVKVGGHLGVDALIRRFPAPVFKFFALFGAFCGVLYGLVLFYGDWLQWLGIDTRGGGALDYWMKIKKIGIGMESIVYPQWMIETFGLQERVHRWIAYLILPVGLLLFSFRCLQAMWRIWRGEQEAMIASHEAEDLVEDNRNAV